MSLPLVIRTTTAVQPYIFDPTARTTTPTETPVTGDCTDCNVTFNVDGQLAALTTTNGVSIRAIDVGPVSEIPEKKVVNVTISPLGRFVVTYYIPGMTNAQNVAIWDAKTGEEVARFQQHKWPALTWTADETVCMRSTATAITFLQGNVRSQIVVGKIQLNQIKNKEHVASMGNQCFVLITPNDPATNTTGSVTGYKIEGVEKMVTFNVKELDGGEIFWSKNGEVAVVITRVDSDKSGKSYYGQSGVVVINPKKRAYHRITLEDGASAHDVSWNPNSEEFALVHGKMPNNDATIYDIKGQPIFHFGTAPRNVVRWSPGGRLLVLGGTGSLNGEFTFWDRPNLGKVGAMNGKLGSFTMKCSSYEWSPCSQYFMCAVVVTRMRADNKVCIFKYTGELVHTVALDNICQAQWYPLPSETFPTFELERVFPPATPTANTTAVAPTEKPKPAVFVPKHRSGAAAALMARAKPEESMGFAGQRRVDQNRNIRVEGLPPGAILLEEDKPKPKPKKQKLKGLQKKLRAVEELLAKDKSTLNAEQLQKLKAEKELRK
eukprot:PhF_6_TR5666/c0_g1_i2/m.8339/K15026/EIF2A; translation initiation factor 2A